MDCLCGYFECESQNSTMNNTALTEHSVTVLALILARGPQPTLHCAMHCLTISAQIASPT